MLGRVGRFLAEPRGYSGIHLARVCAKTWKNAVPARLVDVAVLCDSDDTHTASIKFDTGTW